MNLECLLLSETDALLMRFRAKVSGSWVLISVLSVTGYLLYADRFALLTFEYPVQGHRKDGHAYIQCTLPSSIECFSLMGFA